MKSYVDRAIAVIRGYCDKVVSCSKCRYSVDCDCPFTAGHIPSDWKMDMKKEDKHEAD